MTNELALKRMHEACDRFDSGQIACGRLLCKEIKGLARSLERLGAEPEQIARRFQTRMIRAETEFRSSKRAGLKEMQEAMQGLRTWIRHQSHPAAWQAGMPGRGQPVAPTA